MLENFLQSLHSIVFGNTENAAIIPGILLASCSFLFRFAYAP